jgi:hypothetical protein
VTEAWDTFGLAHINLMDLRASSEQIEYRYALARQAGAAWNRWALYWNLIESDDGMDYSLTDRIVSADVERGVATLAILLGTPRRYSTGGQVGVAFPRVGQRSTELNAAQRAGLAPTASAPAGLDQPVFIGHDGLTDDPALASSINEANPWARFVAATVRRYMPAGVMAQARQWERGKGVRHWEIWNEPNLPHFWSGTVEQYARLLEVAYLAIEFVDPAATVLNGGLSDQGGADRDWFASLLAYYQRAGQSLAARYNYYLDAVAWHYYVYPALLNSGPNLIRALLSQRGVGGRDIWITEYGVPIWSEYPGPCWDPLSPWRATPHEQAAYVIQATAEARAAGVAKLFYFQLFDDCGNGPQSYDAFGMVRNPASDQCWAPRTETCWRMDSGLANQPRPAHAAHSLVSGLLSDSLHVWRPARDSWQRVLLYRPPDERVQVMWNWSRQTQVVEVTPTGPRARLVSTAGGQIEEGEEIPVDGVYRLALPPATNRNNPGNQAAVMGGEPVILIERDTYAPWRAIIEPLPDVSAPEISLAVSAADGGTGLGAVSVWFAEADPARWAEYLSDIPWSQAPLAGTQTVSFPGEDGRTYLFAAQARDRAGNITAPPGAVQAQTTVQGQGRSRIFGTVRSISQVPVHSALVTAAAGGVSRHSRTDADGNFSLEALPQAQYALTARRPGHLSPPPRPNVGSTTGGAEISLVLPAEPNLVANGDFENGLAGWQYAGSLPARMDPQSYNGSKAATLGGAWAASDRQGWADSVLSQQVWLPGLQPVYVSFAWQAASTERRPDSDQFMVEVMPVSDPSGRVVVLSKADWRECGAQCSQDWRYHYFDLSPHAGQSLLLAFSLVQSDDIGPTQLWVDQVAVGPALPGGWWGRWRLFLPSVSPR